MACIVNGNEIVLTGTVGGYYWYEDGFSSADIYMALMTIGADADVVIRLNSGGGSASEGNSSHSTISRHKGKVDVVIEGWAASAASILAMAGDTVTMMPGAVMMIHDPANITIGDAADHERTINGLNAMGDAMAEIYAHKTGKPAAEMRELMKAETWMTGAQAVEAGFADKVGAANDNSEPTAFAIQSYAHVPDHIAAIATARGWKPRKPQTATSAAHSSQTQEIPMTDKERADQLAAELATLQLSSKATADALSELSKEKEDRERRDAILALPEAVGRETLAGALAATTGMTADGAKTILLTSPKAAASDTTDDVADLERRRLNGTGLNGSPSSSKSSGIIANYRAVTGNAKKA